MKKIIIVLFAFFIFTPSILAEGKISNVDVNVSIAENGEATVTEKWTIKKQNIQFLEKNFADVNDVTISDLKVASDRKVQIKQDDKWDKNNSNTYYLKDSNGDKTLYLAVDGEADTYTITYKVKGMVVRFLDAQGIEWYFIPRNSKQIIESFTAHITTTKDKFDSKNTALYAIGSDNLEVSFTDGAIYLYSREVKTSYPIKLMTTFNGIQFSDSLKREYKFETRYNEEVNYNNFSAELSKLINNQIAVIIFAIIGFIVLLIIIKSVFRLFKKHDEYYGIDVYNKDVYSRIETADYYDTTPCNGDLYKIAFLAGYFKILRNRSDLIGAILLKWDFENIVEIVPNSENPHFKIKSGQYFENALDYDLYKVLLSAAPQGYLSGSKLTRYAQDHYLRVMTWFNLGHHNTINDETSRGNITRVKKLRRYNSVLQEPLVADAVNISGLKKYLLHFNQVPRKTPLTPNVYKDLLVLAELLGIGEQVSKEILRKNPDNEMAKKLYDLQTLKHIYKGVYESALVPYKQVVKDSNNTSFDPTVERIIKKDNEATMNRRL